MPSSITRVPGSSSPKNLISFCGDGVTKTGPTQFTVHHANFTPTKDVAVLILFLPTP